VRRDREFLTLGRTPVAALLAGLAVASVALVLLLPYGGREQPDLSYDTPYYVWRTRAVAADGLGLLTEIPTGAVPERPGYPVLGAMLGAITGLDALTFSVIVRAVAAIAIGLAAGAMAVEALGEPRWAFAAFVIGVGASAAVVGTAIGSLDQLLADVLLVGAAATAPLAAAGRRGVVATALLLAAAAATHWVFTALFLVLLLGTVAALVPGSFADRRSGTAWSATSSARLLRLLGVASAATVATLALLPALPDHLPPAVGQKGNLLRLGAYELPVVLPLAVVGLVLAFRRWGSSSSRRTTILLLGLWAASVPLAMAISAILPTPLKLFRVAPFALGMPALATLGLVTLASMSGERLGRGGVVAGAFILVGGLLWASGTPAASFNDTAAGRVAEAMTQARTAGRYLEGVSRGERPVVFVTIGPPRLIDRAVRSGVPPDLIADTWVFVGHPDDLAAGVPVSDPARPRLSEMARAWWDQAWTRPSDVLGRNPIVIQIGPAGRRAVGTTELGPGVAIVRGPEPPASFEPARPVGFGWFQLFVATALALIVLAATGGGWAALLLDASVLATLGLAPAFGVGALVLAGTVVGRFDLPLGGSAGISVVLATAGTGWIVLGMRSRVLRIVKR
jgi:hypothetical protein